MRYIMKISYEGSGYCGFQKQPNKITIQSLLEDSLEKVLSVRTDIVASGRTDAGVSALEQVCHFDCEKELETRRVVGYMNSLLPSDIRVLDIKVVDSNFHARFSAKKKTYEYYFYISKEIIPVYEKFSTLVGYNVDVNLMKTACKNFLGTYDFSAFCASNTSAVDKVRTIYDIDILTVNDNVYKLTITGNGFLYNMVRIIMGTLVDIGRGRIDIGNLPLIIERCDRKMAGKTIDAKGLYLKKVEY